MFTKDPATEGMLDAVVAVEGSFRFRPGIDAGPELNGKFAFANSKTKVTYATGDVMPQMFSPKTTEALLNLMRSMEEDYGKIVFEGGTPSPFGETSLGGDAETEKGLKRGLGG